MNRCVLRHGGVEASEQLPTGGLGHRNRDDDVIRCGIGSVFGDVDRDTCRRRADRADRHRVRSREGEVSGPLEGEVDGSFRGILALEGENQVAGAR